MSLSRKIFSESPPCRDFEEMRGRDWYDDSDSDSGSGSNSDSDSDSNPISHDRGMTHNHTQTHQSSLSPRGLVFCSSCMAQNTSAWVQKFFDYAMASNCMFIVCLS
jgi:hypothetical protein